MTAENLDYFFKPKKVAIIGATNRGDSIAKTLTENLIKKFDGESYPINPNKNKIFGTQTYPDVKKIPDDVNLGVVITPAAKVPEIVEQCGEAEIPALIIHSAGFKESSYEGKKLEDRIEKIRQKYNMRILGPNSLGVMRPSIDLNASISGRMPESGGVAFISQSGALGPSLVRQLSPGGVGLSCFVSVGNMLDVDFADLIDYFGLDPLTRTILMHVESLGDPQKFFGAAKSFSKTKPIVLEKPGRQSDTVGVVSSHIGSTPEPDPLYDALFRRAGVVRVDEISDLFYCSEAMAHERLPEGPNLAIVTNAGGPGILATDALLEKGGNLASLSDETVERLNRFLPSYTSKSNPIDISAGAKIEDYEESIEACLEDENVDGILFIYAPYGIITPHDLADSLVDFSNEWDKPIFACWMGGEDIDQRCQDKICRGGIPTVKNPEQAVRIFTYMYEYLKNKELLYQTPEPLSADEIPLKHKLRQREKLKSELAKLAIENRKILLEEESMRFLQTYDIPTAQTHVVKSSGKAAELAKKIGFPIVLKARSPDIENKREIEGVELNLQTEEEVKLAFEKIKNRTRAETDAEISGVTLQKMVSDIDFVLNLESEKYPEFGSVIKLDLKNMPENICQAKTAGFPPLDQVLGRRIIEQSGVDVILEDVYEEPLEKISDLQEYLARFSQLVIDFPEFEETKLELAVTEKGFSIIDARIALEEEEKSYGDDYHGHLVIEPYPLRYIKKETTKSGKEITIRPIKPEDEPKIYNLFNTLSEESWRHRFFGSMKKITHEDMIRFANVDYRREIALVAEIETEENEIKIIGMGRLIINRGKNTGEFAVLVGDPWQGQGVGSRILESLLDVGSDMNLKSIWGVIRKENFKMRQLCEKLGFHIEEMETDTLKMIHGLEH